MYDFGNEREHTNQFMNYRSVSLAGTDRTVRGDSNFDDNDNIGVVAEMPC